MGLMYNSFMSIGEPEERNCKNYACACDGSCFDKPDFTINYTKRFGEEVYIKEELPSTAINKFMLLNYLDYVYG